MDQELINEQDIISEINGAMRRVRRRLSVREILGHFEDMGASDADLYDERMRLMCDMSYLRDWSDPSWVDVMLA